MFFWPCRRKVRRRTDWPRKRVRCPNAHAGRWDCAWRHGQVVERQGSAGQGGSFWGVVVTWQCRALLVMSKLDIRSLTAPLYLGFQLSVSNPFLSDYGSHERKINPPALKNVCFGFWDDILDEFHVACASRQCVEHTHWAPLVKAIGVGAKFEFCRDCLEGTCRRFWFWARF